ncbi:MAG: hypothetical protein M1548_06800 [Actinobacteria bacterium]|nr:hypothetical protein [Actinomycetota bacterium]
MRVLKTTGLSLLLGALIFGTATMAVGAGRTGGTAPVKPAVVEQSAEKGGIEAEKSADKTEKEDGTLPDGGHEDKGGAGVNHEFEGAE